MSSLTNALPPIKTIIAFGDSITDVGNTKAVSGVPPSPYFNGRFSNGPVWVEYLSGYLSNATLYDFAYGGACALESANAKCEGLSFLLPDLAGQFKLYAKSPSSKADPASTLFTVMAGGNDLSYSNTTSAEASAGAVVAMVSKLLSSGAKRVLVSNMWWVAPKVTTFNAALNSGIASLRAANPTATIQLHDMLKFFTYAVSPAGSAAFGFKNTVDTCLTGDWSTSVEAVCAEPDTYLRWDVSHPTTRTHDLIAQFAFNELNGVDAFLISEPSPSSSATVVSSVTSTSATAGSSTSAAIAANGASGATSVPTVPANIYSSGSSAVALSIAGAFLGFLTI
ncbi:hypothetical protein HDU78_006682 [Chytriomyces hyalinus]|nr:hypothetical protein HDU78_006682 [Chytriomyces hyalinus]